MIEKTIHQIFLKVSDKSIEDYPLFLRNSKKLKTWSEKHGYEYKFHTDTNIDKYFKDKRISDFYNSLRFKWQKIDFLRYVIINHEGGIYIDLDIEILDNVNFDKYIESSEYILGNWYNPKTKVTEVSNSVIGFEKNKLTSLIEYSISETLSKREIKVYETWRKRFMLQTTGVRMFKRWAKKKKKSYSEDLNSFIKDYASCTWNSNFG